MMDVSSGTVPDTIRYLFHIQICQVAQPVKQRASFRNSNLG